MGIRFDDSIPIEVVRRCGGIYRLLNLVTLQIYIGQVCQNKTFAKRWSTHASYLKHQKHENKHLQASYNKYGREAFVFAVLEVVPDAMLKWKEQLYVDRIPVGLSYNKEGPVDSPNLGRKFTAEHCERISQAKKGKKWSEESKRAFSESLSGVPKGPHSEATKAKISKANKGKKRTDEQRLRASQQRMGKPLLKKRRAVIATFPDGRTIRFDSHKAAANNLKIDDRLISRAVKKGYRVAGIAFEKESGPVSGAASE